MVHSLVPPTSDELSAKARTLAARQRVHAGAARATQLQRRLRAEVRRLRLLGASFQTKAEAGEQIPPAAEWLVDNAYLVAEQAQLVLRHFPSGYYRRLPVVVQGPGKGLPRIQALVSSLTDQTGGRCDTETLIAYLRAYQEVQPLTMGELWAVPLLLRAAIVTKLHRVFDELTRHDPARERIDAWLQRNGPKLAAGGESARRAVAEAKERLQLEDPALLVHLARRLREFEATPGLVLRWLENWAAGHGLSLSRLTEEEHAWQARCRMTVEHLFNSLRELSRLSWAEQFEALSLVEEVLRRDPAGIYSEMDFESRDQVRHLVEALARRWRRSEAEVAERAVALAGAKSGADPRQAHVAYYLLPPGRRELAASLGTRLPVRCELRDFLTAHPNAFYFTTLGTLVGFFLYATISALRTLRLFSPPELALLALLLLAPAGEWATQLLHWALMALLPPRPLLKLEFRRGIPPEARTMVVIPALLSSKAEAEELTHRLEVHRLANPGPNLHFALLADLPDAPSPQLPQDDEIITTALSRIVDLNLRYPAAEGSSFYLLHRRRQWNPSEGVWMAWERKRGNLNEFNALLCGSAETSFNLVAGDTSILPTVRYVITLDADTQLPRDTAVKLVGTLAHPLNAAVLSPDGTRVIEGHGLLQPRVSISHASTQRSWYALLNSGKTGLDVYTCAVSDPYQELFRFGIYTGKGIYDVRVFDHLLRQRIPDNSVLSHDLLEGGFLRAGLVTDVELLDDYPSSFLGSLARIHRWARGDLQLWPWLKRRAPDRTGQPRPVGLPLITRWQMVDNWRRIVLSPVWFALLVGALAVLPGRAFSLGLPLLIVLGVYLARWVVHLGHGLRQGNSLLQLLAPPALGALFLPYQALMMLDALVRTTYRMFVSRRHLLEWVPSAKAGRRAPKTLTAIWRQMLGGQLLVLGAVLAAELLVPGAWRRLWLPAAVWLTAPWWAFRLNAPVRRRQPRPRADEVRHLREVARRTWHFFNTLVGPEDHWLPPDNLQLDPPRGVAHRTSPTNMGLLLASTVAARDLGYLTTTQLLERLEYTVDTLERLPRWHGHFYNWYDTVTLEPLEPRYVSSVDSGNLVAYLIAVKEAVQEWLDRPLVDRQTVEGLLDTFRWETARAHAKNPAEPPAALRTFAERHLRHLDQGNPGSLVEWYRTLRQLPPAPALPAYTAAVQAARRELETLLPWLKTLAASEQRKGMPSGQAIQLNLSLGGLLSRLSSLRTLTGIEKAFAGEEGDPPSDWSDRPGHHPDEAGRLERELRQAVGESLAAVRTLLKRGRRLTARLEALAAAHDFRPLFDEGRRLFAIGYNVSAGKLDPSHYDLMASEARQTSFVAIAMGQVPTRHWAALSRLLTLVGWAPTLLSWSGTMFEYFLPLLLLPSYPNTLWDQTYRMVVRRQIGYARRRGLPWGISESGFYAHDFQLNYQYQAFGVPGLGLKPGLGADQVIAPYATFLAGLVEPAKAVHNLHRLETYGALGEYGFYEALDFTRRRVPPGAACGLVKSHMAHHQGMILLSLAHLLLGPRMQRRFLADPRMEATETLLRERTPARALILSQGPPPLPQRATLREQSTDLRYFASADSVLPEARVLSNGRYWVALSNSGGGFSRWGEFSVTRWREDAVTDGSGSFLYLRNLATDALWSPTHHPCYEVSEGCSMRSFLEKVVYERTEGDLHTQMEVCVSPELDAEIRQVTLTNRGRETAVVEATSYLEPVLSPPADDEAHPAFNRLFVETEAVPELQALVAHRRPRRPGAAAPWMAHALLGEGETVGPLEHETDRARFFGRGRCAALPLAVDQQQQLSGTAGAVLDPVLCLRRRLRLEPERSVRFWLVTAAAESREEVLQILRQLQQPFQLTRAFELAWIRSRIELRHLNLSPRQANVFQWLASHLLYFNPYRRRRAEACLRNVKGQSGLWAYGISGDLPIVLVRLGGLEGLNLVTASVRLHEYWRLKGLRFDLVILDDSETSYEQPLQEGLRRLLDRSLDRDLLDRPGGIFVRAGRLVPEEDRLLLETVARLSLDGKNGDLVSQVQLDPEVLAETAFAPGREAAPSQTVSRAALCHRAEPTPAEPPPDLLFFNGWGGFTPSGEAYVIRLHDSELPPQPWSNVLANPGFGCLVSEAGGGYTWSENSREHKLTPWSNDPVLDPPGEVCYLRDEESGCFWSLTPLPIREPEPYEVRHGQGYTLFTHRSHGLVQEGLVFVTLRDPVKILRLTLSNEEDRPRRLSVVYYAEWVLGVNRHETSPYLVTEWESESGTLLARNVYQEHFRDRRAFLHLAGGDGEEQISYTGDRAEFVGRNRSLSHPAGLEQQALSKRTGALYNPCGAVQLQVELPPRGERTVVVLLGAAPSVAEVQRLVAEYRRVGRVEEAFQEVRSWWDQLLGRVQVSTPDPGLNLLLDRWLLYQTLSCRLWARSAFYQSGGAYGFRDQLQDALALLHAAPDLLRRQLLRHAAHQFQEGDVQHWWHEETAAGIRTRVSDDLLWLPYAACRYAAHTGDETIWEEAVPFLEGEPLAEGEDERYGPTRVSAETGSLYEHCVRAIDHALRFGAHGLPLIGTGDWNDGLNHVGREGRGESVWLGWFLYTVLQAFAPVCRAKGEVTRAETYEQTAAALSAALDRHGWDGQWYRRAYTDQGTPLGSLQNEECQIDCIAQAWAAISGAAPPAKVRAALASVHHRLLDRDEGLLRLLTPPFAHTEPSPGYIQAYPRGVRENGGQYTHGAVWAIIGWATLGEGNRAYELLRLLNPIYHAQTQGEALRYRVEPYVVAADVYAAPPYAGRGGWTWYTGAAGWLYQAALEWVLGVRRRGARLYLKPCIPELWREYSVSYAYGRSRYEIQVKNPHGRQTGASSLELDGMTLEPADPSIPLVDDGQTHRVVLTL